MKCKKSIKEKKPTAKFCSTKCKNAHHGKLRTKERKRKRQDEIKTLERIIKQLPKTNVFLSIIYQDSHLLEYVDHLQQAEITYNEWANKVSKVIINDFGTPQPVELTTVRAKKLIREIARHNEK